MSTKNSAQSEAPHRTTGMGRRSSRERLIQVTADLLQRQGYEASGIKEIVTAADTTASSLYHHFPGGKQELTIAALAHGEQRFTVLLQTALARESTPAAAVAACALDLADMLERTDWIEGCPVAITALESVTRWPDLRAASVGVLERWQDIIAARLRADGWDQAAAAGLASTVLSTLEGAELLSRVRADPTPLRMAAQHLARLIESTTPCPADNTPCPG